MRERKRHPRAERMSRALAGALEMPESGLANVPTVTLCSNSEATVEGCMGIVEYTDTAVRLATGRMDIRIVGAGLHLAWMNSESTMVRGEILGVEFLAGSGEKGGVRP